MLNNLVIFDSRALLIILIVFFAERVNAQQQPGANYDESKVPTYTLPDPLRLSSGEKVNDAQNVAAAPSHGNHQAL